MSDPKGYYTVLGVNPDATQEEIQLGWRRMLRRAHPDRYKNSGGDANDDSEIKKVNEAYGVLRDATKRAQYDEEGEIADSAEKTDSQANELLTKKLIEAINSHPDVIDLLSLMAQGLNAHLGDLHNMKNGAIQAENKLRVYAKRTRKKGEKENNLIRIFCEREAEIHKKNIKEFNRAIRVANLAVQKLQDYDNGGDFDHLISSPSTYTTTVILR